MTRFRLRKSARNASRYAAATPGAIHTRYTPFTMTVDPLILQDQEALDLPEPTRQSFILRVWVERTTEEAGQATWRGRIVHVPSGVQALVDDLDQVGLFVAGYLGRMGVRLTPYWRFKRWIERRK